MTTKRSRKTNGGSSNLFSVDVGESGPAPMEPRYTGRYIVLLAPGSEAAAQKVLAKAAGLKHVASAADFQADELSADA